MNSQERFHNRLRGLPVDRPPNFNILMQRAAHHIGAPLRRYYLEASVLAEANLACAADFDLDILQAISDPYRETYDLGAEIEFPDDGLPLSKVPLVASWDDLAKLPRPGFAFGRRMTDRLEAVRILRERSGGEIPVMGWVEGALAEAGDLRGISTLMTDLYDSPEALTGLLETLTEIEVRFAVAQVQAGADIIGLGDAVASQISPPMYRKFGLPYEQRIFAAVRAAGGIPRLHICGNTTRLLADMAKSGAQIVDLDWMVDLEKARSTFGDEIAPCGNHDPVAVMLQGSPRTVQTAVTTFLQAAGPRSLSMAGCEVPDGTPVENFHAHSAALTAWAAG
jgi:MtaA/CmuA family methyltransferase